MAGVVVANAGPLMALAKLKLVRRPLREVSD